MAVPSPKPLMHSHRRLWVFWGTLGLCIESGLWMTPTSARKFVGSHS